MTPIEGNTQDSGEVEANRQSSEEGSQPFEAKFAELNTTLSAALKKIEAQDGEIRALKSGKDKAVSRALDEIQPMKETVAKLAQYLNIPEAEVVKAQKAMVLDDLVNERMKGGGQLERPAEGTDERKSSAVEFQIVDELLELPTNDPRVTQLKLDHGKDINAYKEAAKKLKASLKAADPTPAEQPLPQGASRRQADTAALESELERLSKNPSAPGAMRRITEIQKELQAQ